MKFKLNDILILLNTYIIKHITVLLLNKTHITHSNDSSSTDHYVAVSRDVLLQQNPA